MDLPKAKISKRPAKTRRLSLAVLSITLAATTALAGNESRYSAYPLTGRAFEVVAEFSENAIYWCGASLYARAELGAAATQMIFVLRGPAPSQARPGQKSVTFTLTPPDGTPAQSYTNSVTLIGNALSVTQAYGGCSERSSSG